MTHLYQFFDDYSETAHPQLLEALASIPAKQDLTYGYDDFTKEAVALLREKIEVSQADIHLVSSGTQANLVVLAACLKPFESVIAAENGHTNHHEAGAIEATGHKINAVKVENGKLTPEAIQNVLDEHKDEYMVKPGAVYISQATELGTIYSKEELEAIYTLCQAHKLYLYIDGARLGVALTATANNLDLPTIAKLCDAFYVGGTKNGALLGEAIILLNSTLKEEFRRHLRQRGALLAKSKVLGSQFLELFKNDLYYQNARHATEMAQKLQNGIKACGYSFLVASQTNQIFPILPNDIIEKLQALYGFYIWGKSDEDNSIVRLVTSWATPEEAVDGFIKNLQQLPQ